MARLFIVLGLALLVLGLLLQVGGGRLLSWFGHLPGDVRIERPGFRLYVPWVSLLLVSVVLNGLLWLWRRFSG